MEIERVEVPIRPEVVGRLCRLTLCGMAVHGRVQPRGGATVIGPLIVGLEKPVQIVSLGAKDSDIVNMAALASFNIGG